MRVINPNTNFQEATLESKLRTERIVNRIQTLDEDKAKQYLLDERTMNGKDEQFDLYFQLANQFLTDRDGLIAVNARRHGQLMYASSHWLVEGFMVDVRKYIETSHPDKVDEYEEPGLTSVKNAFLPGNEFVGAQKSSRLINFVRKISTKQNHIVHIDSYACNTLWRIVKDILFLFNLEVKKLRLNEVIVLPFYRSVEEKINETLEINGSDRSKYIDRRQIFLFMSSNDKA